MIGEKMIDRVRKLLALSTSSNENEAKAALLQAQKLMEKHKISEAMIAEPAVVQEDIKTSELWNSGKTSRSQWRGNLAATLGKCNGCEVWTSGPRIHIIGRESNVQTVQYLFLYCESLIERLSKTHAGHGRSFISNYKLGFVGGIASKLKQGKEEAMAEAVVEHGKQLTDNAIVRIDEKALENKKLFDQVLTKLNLKFTTFGKQSYNEDARLIGFKDGRKVDLSSKPGIESGTTKRIG